MCRIYRYLPQKTCSYQKKNMINKKWRNITKMQHRLCIIPFLEVTILFNQHVIIVGNTVGKSPTGILHSNLIYLILKPLKLQNFWRIFDRPVSSMYCKYAEYACKFQKNLPMTNKTCDSKQKKCNIVLLFTICRINRYLPKKTCSWSIKKNTLCRKNAISSSADPRTPRLLTSNIIQLICMYMYTYYVIFTAHIYVCV